MDGRVMARTMTDGKDVEKANNLGHNAGFILQVVYYKRLNGVH